MTLKIEIEAHPERGDLGEQIANAMKALGFTRDRSDENMAADQRALGAMVGGVAKATAFGQSLADNPTAGDLDEPEAPAAAEPEKPKRGRKPKAETPEPTPAISTGAERVDPTVTPEDAAQDAADEARETAAAKAASGGALTRDDVRKAAGEYIKRYGMAHAQADIPAILGCTQVEIPDTQEALAEAVSKLKKATQTNSLGREFVGGDAVEPRAAEPVSTGSTTPTATKDDVIKVIFAYGAKYDGTTDPKAMTFTMEDGAQVLMARFGPDVKKLSQIPATPEAYGQAVADLTEMLEKNPYGREARG